MEDVILNQDLFEIKLPLLIEFSMLCNSINNKCIFWSQFTCLIEKKEYKNENTICIYSSYLYACMTILDQRKPDYIHIYQLRINYSISRHTYSSFGYLPFFLILILNMEVINICEQKQTRLVWLFLTNLLIWAKKYHLCYFPRS